MTTLIIDGNNQAFVSNMAMDLCNEDGFPTQAIHGFFKAMLSYAKMFEPDEIMVAWDGARSKKRIALFPEYKAGRADKKSDPIMEEKITALRLQIPEIIEICKALGWTQFMGGEADDSIAIASQILSANKKHVIIVSGDKDFYQLINEYTSIFNPVQAAKVRHVTLYNFYEARGMRPDQWLNYRAMTGDASDGIPGAFGVGEGTAKAIIDTFDTPFKFYNAVLEGQHAPKRFEKNLIKDWDGFLLSRMLMDLKLGSLLADDTHRVAYLKAPDNDTALSFFEKFNMDAVLSEFDTLIA